MIVKVLVVGDPHTKIESIQDILLLAKRIVAQALIHKPTFIVILGDLADSFEKIHILCLNAIVEFFRTLQGLGIPIYYVVGNHDCINNQVFLEDLHAFNAFKKWHNITVVDRPTWGVGDAGFALFCPYVPPGRLVEALSTESVWERARVIFCHQEFRGTRLGSIVSKHGDVWKPEYPQVVTGHIHEHGNPYSNVLEVGAPRDVAFGDSGDKTISLLSFDVGGSVLQPTPMEELRIDLQMPRKVSLTLTIEDAKALQLPENASIRITLVGTSEDLAAFKKTKEYATLKQNAKIIPKVLNPASDKKGSGRATYLELLRAACADESPMVREAFDELTQGERNAG